MSMQEQHRERRQALVQERRRVAEAQGRRDRVMKWGIALGTVAVVAALVGFVVWANLFQGSSGLPGPLGGPSVSKDVNTLVGKPAAAFTLSDSDGKGHTVTPGQGKPLVLVTHMGVT